MSRAIPIKNISAIVICALYVGCTRSTAVNPGASDATVWRCVWYTGETTLRCLARRVAVGNESLDALQITGGRLAKPFTVRPFGRVLSINTLMIDAKSGEELLLVGSSAGANTYSVDGYRYDGHDVREVADILADSPEYGVIDVDSDGVSEIVVMRRVSPDPVLKGCRYIAYKWNGSTFMPYDMILHMGARSKAAE